MNICEVPRLKSSVHNNANEHEDKKIQLKLALIYY